MTEKIFKELTDEEKAYWHKEGVERKRRDDLSRLEEARREGASMGDASACRRIARSMKSSGMPPEEIMKFTGLTAQENKEL